MKSALQAVSRLHNRVLEPVTSATKGKKAGASAGTLMWARQVSGEGLHMKKWRLIIRNLAFDVRPLRLGLQGACQDAGHVALGQQASLAVCGLIGQTSGCLFAWFCIMVLCGSAGQGEAAAGAAAPRRLCLGVDHSAQARRYALHWSA